MTFAGVIRILLTGPPGPGGSPSVLDFAGYVEGNPIPIVRGGPLLGGSAAAEGLVPAYAAAIAMAFEGLLPKGKIITSFDATEGTLVSGRRVMAEIVDAPLDPCGNVVQGLGLQRARARQIADALMRLGSVSAIIAEGGIFGGDIDTARAEAYVSVSSALCPREYQPVSVQVDEDTGNTFIEPGISATYFDCVSLRVGSEWAVSDFSNGKLYYCQVKRRERVGAGLISYTFTTPMTLLNHTEPPSLIVAAGDEGVNFGVDATPKEALAQVILPHFKKLLPQLTWGNIPDFKIRTGEGATTIPTVPVVHIVQEQRPQSIREILENMLSPFQGYTYRMDGWNLQIIAPSWAQLSPNALTLTDDNLISLLPAENDDTIINTQKVTYRPWEFLGDFEDPDSLEPIAEPAYYRVGFTEELGPPDNRRLVKNEKPAPWALNMAAKKDKVLVTWTAYIFGYVTGQVVGQQVDNGELDLSGKIIKKVHTFEMTREGYYIAETVMNLYINKGNGGAPDYFGGNHRTQFARSDGIEPEGNHVKFRWRLELKNAGVVAKLEYPSPETIFTFHSFTDSDFGVLEDVDVKIGAEFHLDVRGVTFQQSPITYSATYGVQVPAVGVEPPDGSELPTEIMYGRLPPKLEDYVEDSDIRESYELYGRREGPEIVIDVWTLTLPTERDLVGEPILDFNTDYETEIIASLTGIAETVVKNRLNPSRDYAIELAAPFVLSPSQIATSVALPGTTVGGLTLPGDVGELSRITYGEAHGPGSLALSATAIVTVTEVADIRRFNQTPGTAPDREENELPAPLPPEGPVTEDPSPPTAITVTGSQDLELPFVFLLKSIDGPNGARLRLFRTAAARTADTSRAADVQPPETLLPLIIADDTIEEGNHLDIHATISHTTDTKIYALAEGGTVTLNIFQLTGRDR